jgi:hypothetical protein
MPYDRDVELRTGVIEIAGESIDFSGTLYPEKSGDKPEKPCSIVT